MSNEQELTWLNGASLSVETVDCSGLDKAMGIFFEAGFNTTQVTFEVIANDAKVGMLRDLNGTEVNLTVNQTLAEYLPLDPQVFGGINKFKVRRGTQGSPFTTAAENTQIKLIKREY